ncbi:hypothetical protein P8625_00995 [Tenacibaculum tangerinum]|uniref:Uncharacterized protein n=1 Tax=Tenacibaculum tangerinum TaxID=3038772 RepID=A0ABY8L758_9FLAO|nr:hypothetical protein [Tenacibaculum tangerinum]WGH75770.1 hypothetical protein P8625_00995 [Tenacibaculum tangerinum]
MKTFSSLLLTTLIILTSNFDKKEFLIKWQKHKLKINEDASGPAKITFTVNEDNTPVYLRVKNTSNFLIKKFHLDSPDIYGRTQWKINIQSGGHNTRTRLNKGTYAFTIEGGIRTTIRKYGFDMEVGIKQEDKKINMVKN